MLAPMPLSVAVAVCFPHGGVTKSTLLAAIRRGVLGYEKIGHFRNGWTPIVRHRFTSILGQS